VVLVSHRVVNKVLICSMLGLDNSHFWDIKQDLGGITVFEYEGSRYKLIKHNSSAILSEAFVSQIFFLTFIKDISDKVLRVKTGTNPH
jgi:broad specificity phosphatase PhoE